MKAAVLSTGTELTRGELINSNAAWLSEQLTALGYEVVEHATVDDDRARIRDTLRRLASTVRVVVSTGGLGPTTDDLTAEAVASALEVPLVRDAASLEHIRRFFERLGRTMGAVNEKQADFPQGSVILPNAHGTAPGFEVRLGACRAFFLPGVPREMKPMFGEHVARAIATDVARTRHQVHLRTLGLGESDLQTRLADLESKYPGLTVGYRATMPEVEVKLLGVAADEASAESIARSAEEDVRGRLGDIVYGDRDDTFPGVVGRVLRDRGLRLSVAESCTGGMVSSLLTEVPGSSDFLVLDVVAYANAAKTAVLGVPEDLLRAHGAVSAEVARAMAEGARRLADADLAVSITGIAGPGGGSEDKPVGTVHIALVRRGGEVELVHRVFPPGDRQRVRRLAAFTALRMVWLAARAG